jgi:hypothetical protein
MTFTSWFKADKTLPFIEYVENLAPVSCGDKVEHYYYTIVEGFPCPACTAIEAKALAKKQQQEQASLIASKVLEALQEPFQARVKPWLNVCFGEAISNDKVERNHRFLEESLELVQACGCSKEEALQLVDYVYDRPVGELSQEIGGVMVTLAALCLANNVNMHADGEAELARIWTKIDKIRAKQKEKPTLKQ